MMNRNLWKCRHNTTADNVCTRGMRTIDGHEEQLLRLYDLEELLQIPKDLDDHLLLCDFPSGVVPVCAIVDDAIHVQVKVVDYWHVRFCYRLIYKRIPLTQPPVELWNTCSGTRSVCMPTSPLL